LPDKRFYHKQLAGGRWFELSFIQQMGNIGSEVYRAIKWFREKNEKRFRISFEMALELFELTIKDSRYENERINVIKYRSLFFNVLTNYENTQNPESKLDLLNNKFYEYGLVANEERCKLYNNNS
jgi:hypothetical protein